MSPPTFKGRLCVSHSEIEDAVAEWSDDLLRTGQVVGMALAVRRRREPLIINSTGVSDRERRVAASADTVFRIGSLTKELAAAAVLRLSDDGVLSLTDSIVRWFPELSAWEHRPTVAELLSHTSGLPPSLPALAPLVARTRRPEDEARVLDALLGTRLVGAPGEEWRYSNAGYLLVGHLVARATGMGLDEYLSSTVLRRLGIVTMGESDSLKAYNSVAAAYDLSANAGEAVAAEYVNLATVGAAGAWSASVRDLAAWDDAMAADRILTSSSRLALRHPTRLQDGSTVEYGLGVFVGTLGPYAEVLHRGDIPGGAAFKAVYPDAGVSVIVLANTAGAPVSRLGRRIARHVLSLPQPNRQAVTTVDGELGPFVGDYRDEGVNIRIVSTQNGLVAETPDGPLQLRPSHMSGTRACFFAVSDPDLTCTIERHGDGSGWLQARGPAVHFDGVRRTLHLPSRAATQ